MTKEQIVEEAEKMYPYPKSYDYVIKEKREGYVTAASKYTTLLEEKDLELARLTAEAEQSLLLYNNMTATIVKRDEEIKRLKDVLKEVNNTLSTENRFLLDIKGLIAKIESTLNTKKQQ